MTHLNVHSYVAMGHTRHYGKDSCDGTLGNLKWHDIYIYNCITSEHTWGTNMAPKLNHCGKPNHSTFMSNMKGNKYNTKTQLSITHASFYDS